MKSKWHTVRLGDVCQVNPDKRDSSWPHSVISYIDIASVGNGVLNERPRTVRVAEAPGRAQRLVRAGDTIVSTVRPNRRSFLYVSEPAPTTVVSTGFAVLRAGKGLDPRFLYYLVTDQSFTDYLVAHEEGSAYPAVNSSVLGDAEVTIPELLEQRSIGRILGTLDDKIELNRRMNETLEAMARALFKSWFIDFDSVHAKAEGRDPSLPADIAALFPDSFESSDFGEIPRGWRLRRLKDVLKDSNERVGGEQVQEYSSTNTGLELRSEHFNKRLAMSSAKNKLVRDGDLVFGLSRRVLNFGLMRDRIGSVSSAYKVFTVDRHEVAPDFLERMMRERSGYFYNAVSGSTREGQAVSSEGLEQLRFVQPQTTLQKEFYRITGRLHTLAAALKRESATIAEIRDAFLPRLLSGELRVPQIDEPSKGYS
jgi:type I restriction enzyme S subunit